VIVDTSVVVKAVARQEGWREALDLLSRTDLVSPDFLDLEVANALTGILRSRKIDRVQLAFALARASSLPIARAPTLPLVPAATELSVRLYASFFDCLYLALAIDRSDVLVTADLKFVNAVNSAEALKRRVRPL